MTRSRRVLQLRMTSLSVYRARSTARRTSTNATVRTSTSSRRRSTRLSRNSTSSTRWQRRSVASSRSSGSVSSEIQDDGGEDSTRRIIKLFGKAVKGFAVKVKAKDDANSVKDEKLEVKLGKICEIIEKMTTGKKNFAKQMVECAAGAANRDPCTCPICMEQEEQPDRVVRERSFSESSEDSVFIKTAPHDGDEGGDGAGGRIRATRRQPPRSAHLTAIGRPQCLSYSGYFHRVTLPERERRLALEKAADEDEDPDEDLERQAIFYSDEEMNDFGCQDCRRSSGDEKCACTDDSSLKANPPTSNRDDASSPIEVVTICSDAEDGREMVNINSDSEGDNEVQLEAEIITIDAGEGARNEDSIEVDMEEEEAAGYNPESMEETAERVKIMEDNPDAFTLKEVGEVSAAMRKFMDDEERDLTGEEFEMIMGLHYVVDQITNESIGFMAIGDGIMPPEEVSDASDNVPEGEDSSGNAEVNPDDYFEIDMEAEEVEQGQNGSDTDSDFIDMEADRFTEEE